MKTSAHTRTTSARIHTHTRARTHWMFLQHRRDVQVAILVHKREAALIQVLGELTQRNLQHIKVVCDGTHGAACVCVENAHHCQAHKPVNDVVGESRVARNLPLLSAPELDLDSDRPTMATASGDRDSVFLFKNCTRRPGNRGLDSTRPSYEYTWMPCMLSTMTKCLIKPSRTEVRIAFRHDHSNRGNLSSCARTFHTAR